MTSEELRELSRAELIHAAQRAGVGREAYTESLEWLIAEIIRRRGEAADDTVASLRAELDSVRAEVRSLRAEMGRAIVTIEEMAAQAKWLSEAAIMTTSNHRAPTPDEVALLSRQALNHLGRQLAIESPNSLSKAALMSAIADKMRWKPWAEAQ